MYLGLLDRVLYPNFYQYLRYSLPDVAKSTKIRQGFLRYGQLDDAGLKRAAGPPICPE